MIKVANNKKYELVFSTNETRNKPCIEKRNVEVKVNTFLSKFNNSRMFNPTKHQFK